MKQQLARTDDAPNSEIVDLSGGLLGVIARAARDPSVDIDKMERLIALQERVQDRDARIAFIEAKRAMRPSLPVITERGKIIIRDKGDRNKIVQETSFALFEDLNEILMPIVTEHGFDITFRNGTGPDGKVRVYTVLSHIEGHSEETFFDLPPDGSGSKNAVQAIGSSTSYAKRYGMLEILNVTTKGEDDGGVAAGNVRVVEPTRAQRLRDAPFPQGPAKNKTELKTMGRTFWREVEGCGDMDELDALLLSHGPLTKQLAEALPDWWNGGSKDGEPYDGLATVIANRQTALAAAQQAADYVRAG